MVVHIYKVFSLVQQAEAEARTGGRGSYSWELFWGMGRARWMHGYMGGVLKIVSLSAAGCVEQSRCGDTEFESQSVGECQQG